MRANINRNLTFVISLFFFIAFGIFEIATAQTLSSNYSTKFEAGDLFVKPGDNGEAIFQGEDLTFIDEGGEGLLPYKRLSLLLHSGVMPESCKASYSSEKYKKIPGEWKIKNPSPLVHSNQKKNPKSHRREYIRPRKSKRHVPNSPIYQRGVRVGSLRNWKIIDIPVSLVKFYPRYRALYKLESLTVDVECSLEGNGLEASRAGNTKKKHLAKIKYVDDIGRERVEALVDNHPSKSSAKKSESNYGDILSSYDDSKSSEVKDARISTSRRQRESYVIMTTNAILDKIDGKILQGFIQLKEERGYAVHVVTEDRGPIGIGGFGSSSIYLIADKAREWLKDNYIKLGTKYLLLIGDPTPQCVTGYYPSHNRGIPMKMLWPRHQAYEDRKASGDIYYAELSSDWEGVGNLIILATKAGCERIDLFFRLAAVKSVKFVFLAC